MSIARQLGVLSLLLAAAGSGMAQTPAQSESFQGDRKINYKRFTRGDDAKVVDEAWARLQWWRERIGGDLGPDFFQRYVREAEQEKVRFPAAFRQGYELPAAGPLGTGTWVNLGPTTSDFTQNGVTLNKVDSGRPRTILPHPTDPDTVYFLTCGGGLWKTSNFTAAAPTWVPKSDFVGSTSGGAAAFGRTSSVVYLAHGDAFDRGVGGFLVKSTDGGDNWGSAVFLGTASRVLDLQVDTSQGSTTAEDIILAGTNAGLYRSSDGGASFSAVGTGVFTSKSVWSVVKTSAGWLASAQDNTSGAGSLHISTDRGANWTAITNTGNGYTGAGRSTLGVAAPGEAVVYCFAADTGDNVQKDLFKSTDGGQTWTALGITSKTPTNPSSDQTNMDLMANQAFYNHMILVDPSDATRNTIYLGGQLASAKTTNGGTTWTLLSDWLAQDGLQYVHADFHAAAHTSAGGGNRLFFGTDGGLFTSANGGTTWDDTKNNGLVTHLIYALTANPATAGSALVGLQDNGTRIRKVSPTLTSTFNQIRGGDGFGVGWSQANQASTLASYVYNSIRRSTSNPPDSQTDFSSFTSGLGTTNSSSYYFVTPIVGPTAAADPSGNVFFTYGNGGSGANAKQIYKSSSSGWTTIGTAGSGGWTSGTSIRSVSHGLGIHPTDINRIAGARSGGVILLTTNGGTSWTEVLLGSTGTDGQNIGWYGFNANVAWADNNILYACAEATTTGAAHVAKSVNGGSTWTRADSGLPDLPVTKVVVDPGDATGNTVYAATWTGVYRTVNGGGSWTRFGTGLPQVRVTDLYIAPDSSYLRVSTWGRGVWELITGSSPVHVAIPGSSTVFLSPNASRSFSALVTNAVSDNKVNWSAGAGSFSPTQTVGDGMASTRYTIFTAPSTPQVLTVTATSNESSSASATVTVNVYDPAAVTISVSPNPRTVLPGGSVNFSATVTNSPGNDQTVTWSVQGGSANGTITNTGAYTAPATAGTYTVVATSPWSSTSSGTASVIVKSHDLNGDSAVDVLDILEMTKRYGSTASVDLTKADLDGDGDIDDTDLSTLLAGI